MGTLQPCSQEVLRNLATRLEAAGHGDRSNVIREASTHYGVSVQTLYRKLQAVGWQSGRKARTDKGTSSVSESALIIRRCEVLELKPLDTGLGDYLTLKFKRVGNDLSKVFDADGIDAVRSRLTEVGRGPSRNQAISMTYPLVVNNLVTKAMNAAAVYGAPKVTADIVKGC